MAATVKDVREWLQGFRDEDEIAIDEGGLILEIKPAGATDMDRADGDFEIGGWPEITDTPER